MGVETASLLSTLYAFQSIFEEVAMARMSTIMDADTYTLDALVLQFQAYLGTGEELQMVYREIGEALLKPYGFDVDAEPLIS